MYDSTVMDILFVILNGFQHGTRSCCNFRVR